MELTYHAEIRMRQRGFRNDSLDTILQYGHCVNAPGKAEKIILREKEYRAAIPEFRMSNRNIQPLDHLKGVTVILSAGKILTVYKHHQ